MRLGSSGDSTITVLGVGAFRLQNRTVSIEPNVTQTRQLENISKASCQSRAGPGLWSGQARGIGKISSHLFPKLVSQICHMHVGHFKPNVRDCSYSTTIIFRFTLILFVKILWFPGGRRMRTCHLLEPITLLFIFILIIVTVLISMA